MKLFCVPLLLLICSISSAFGMDEPEESVKSRQTFEKSDLDISSLNFMVSFYNAKGCYTALPSDSERLAGFYKTAVIFSRLPVVDGVVLRQYKEGPLHYICLEDEKLHEGLGEELEYVNNYFRDMPRPQTDAEFTPLVPCKETTLETLCADLLKSDTVCVTFGAGISGEYVPTLQEMFTSVGLKKVPSKDRATDETLFSFIQRLVAKPQVTLSLIRQEWGKVRVCKIESTPAHVALKGLLDVLQTQGKEIFVYTDNIDGIHKKTGILLARKEVEGRADVIYPPLDSKNVTVLVCGQSFDFDGVLSTIKTRESVARQVNFYSLNLLPDTISLYEGLDVGKAQEGLASGDPSQYVVKPLEGMLHIPGSLHETLPRLLSLVKQ